MPFHDATYLSGTDCIYATMGNQIYKLNATTGLRITSAKVAPCHGPMRIAGLGSTLYVAASNDHSHFRNVAAFETSNQIWNVDASTLAVTDYFQFSLNWWMEEGYGNDYFLMRYPNALLISNGFLYSMFGGQYYNVPQRFYTPNKAAEYFWDGTDSGITGYNFEQFAVDSNRMWVPDTNQSEIELYEIAHATNPIGAVGPRFTYASSCDTSPFYPCAITHIPGTDKVYVMTGTDTILSATLTGPWALPATCTPHLLGPVYANAAPVRSRYNYTDGKLYLPCQNEGVVIVWNPVTETGTAKTGFDSPIDVVFTPTKQWAIQSAPVGIKEIT